MMVYLSTKFIKNSKFWLFITKFFICIVFNLLASIFFNHSLIANQGQAIEIRTGRREGSIYRVVIETNIKTIWKSFILKNPNRLVIDVSDISINGISNRTKKLGGIYAVRVGMFSSNTARFVLETKEEIKIVKTLYLPPSSGMQWRIVIDFMINIGLQNQNNSDEKNISNNSKSTQQSNNHISEFNNKRSVNFDKPIQLSPVKRSKYIIVLDPGHGGKDPGAKGVSGILFEKNLVLSVAKMLQNELTKDGRYKVIMTRSTDVYIPLWRRAQIAEENNADLFISIHADSHPKPHTKGLSVYTLSDNATDYEARKLAEKENASDLMGLDKDFKNYNKDVRLILSDVAQMLVKESSVTFGDTLVKEINKSKNIKSLPNRPLREAPFWVLRSSVPSVLVELGYLSNKQEETLLKDDEYRLNMAKTIKYAIDKMFNN